MGRFNNRYKRDMKQGVKWTTKEGRVMLVDDMTEQHAKNALKMMIRRFEEVKKIIKEEIIDKRKTKPKFEVHGDIAQDQIEQMMLSEYEQDMGIEDNFYNF